ncbi:MAG TPA: aminoglycoside phosphotransferase [Nocardioidaceae bacterium]|nr:aminoglycoside phosphotransferase [Nocardioidaceae bacterium]
MTSYEDDVHAYLGGQRWFAGKGRPYRVVGSSRLGWLSSAGAEPAVRVELVEVEYDGGERATYQLPLAYYAEDQGRLSHALVGRWDDTDLGNVAAYDALHDRFATTWLLEGLDAARQTPDMSFFRLPGAQFPLGEPSLLLTAEQSNSSVIFGEEALLKVFRKVENGRNPDIEIHAALTAHGATNVAPLLGWVEARWQDADGEAHDVDLAMAQTFLRTATNGWELALTSVRDLFAEGDLHADEVGGDFAAEAHRLGVVTGQIHAELATLLPTERWGRDQVSAVTAGMRARLARAVDTVPPLAERAPLIEAVYERLSLTCDDLPVQRVHGDLHLGQSMRTVDGWKLLDFEGEPARPLAQRTAMDSPLRDVAGMLRSFDYAAHTLVLDHAPQPQIEFRAVEWVTRNSSAFCDGYAEVSSDPRAERALLRAYELDKVVYEAAYEHQNRPSWLPIPLGALDRMLAELARNDVA